MIGGNTTATIQMKIATKNEIGEQQESWVDWTTVLGWLDYSSGSSDLTAFKGKMQSTTHVFMCDFAKWQVATQESDPTPEAIRMVIGNDVFNVLLIDNPMKLNQHLEIFLEYVGGGLNG